MSEIDAIPPVRSREAGVILTLVRFLKEGVRGNTQVMAQKDQNRCVVTVRGLLSHSDDDPTHSVVFLETVRTNQPQPL